MPFPIVPIALGLAQLATGAINKKKANEEARKLKESRPTYLESPLVQQELDLAESEAASGGFSATSLNAYENLDNAQFAGSLGAILRGGGGVNNVADLYSGSQEGRMRLSLLNDQLRMAKLDRLSRARQLKMGEQDKEFLYNQDAPWKDNAQAVAIARQQATNDIWSGIQTAGSGISQYMGQQYNQKMYDRYFDNMNRSSSTYSKPTSFSELQEGKSLGRSSVNPYQLNLIPEFKMREYKQQYRPIDREKEQFYFDERSNVNPYNWNF